MHTLDYNIGETSNFLRSDIMLASSLSTPAATGDKSKSIAEATVDSILKNLTHAGVQSIVVIKRMYINFNIQVRSSSFHDQRRAKIVFLIRVHTVGWAGALS